MHSNRTTDGDFEVINGQLVLKDGHKYTVPMRALDGLQKSVAEHFGRTAVQDAKIVDGYGEAGLSSEQARLSAQHYRSPRRRPLSHLRSASAPVTSMPATLLETRASVLAALLGSRSAIAAWSGIFTAAMSAVRAIEVTSRKSMANWFVSAIITREDALDGRTHDQRMADLYSEYDRNLADAVA